MAANSKGASTTTTLRESVSNVKQLEASLSRLNVPVKREASCKAPIYKNTICIEGNIGSGKSTLITGLSRLGLNVHPEPVRQVWGKYLPILYGDPARWGMCFQMEVLDWFNSLQNNFKKNIAASKAKAQAGKVETDDQSKENQTPRTNKTFPRTAFQTTPRQIYNPVYNPENIGNMTKRGMSTIIERSPTSAYQIFSVNLYECGLLTEWEKSLLNRFYSITEWRPEYVIYLRTPPDCCCQRIRERSRKGEDRVNSELVNQLHMKHEELFNMEKSKDGTNIIIIDGKKSKQNVMKDTIDALLKLGFEFQAIQNSPATSG